MSDWMPISTYKHTDYRDADGKWHPGPPGPMVDLKFENGRVVRRAQWRGEKTVKGGLAYAFWAGSDRSGIGSSDPSHWRPAQPL